MRALLDERSSSALIERRRARGVDVYDEIWEGTYVVNPAPGSRHARLQLQIGSWLTDRAEPHGLEVYGPVNVGTADDHRVPDLTVATADLDAVWVGAATMVVEVVSPDEDATAKLDFYRARVAEVLVVEPARQRITLHAGAEVVAESGALGFTVGDLAAHLGW